MFLTLSALALFFRERAKNKLFCQEITYIKNRLGGDLSIQENGYILIPSENPAVKELSAELNRLLEVFHLQKAEYHRSKRAMVQVLANISHDLRTPLTVLKGYSELLVRDMGNASVSTEMQNMITRIDVKADELVKTVNEYFTMSKIESGDMQMDIQRTDITALCRQVILDYYDILEKEQFEVDIRIGSAPVFACADGQALERILKNLIDNAIRHGNAGKYLGIRLSQASGQVKIDIEDHGAGIADRDQERIFFRNYTTAHKGSGSGLGLAIAKNLAQQMEASLAVSSKPGEKTLFSLTLKS